MQLSNSLTPRSVSSSNYLLRQYGGAAAAYSLQRLDTSVENVVRARRSTDDAEADFTAQEVSGGSLREFALNNDADLIRFADQAVAADKRMYFDGSNDVISVSGMTAAADYFGACTIQVTAVVTDSASNQALFGLGAVSYRLQIFAGQWYVNGVNTGASVSSVGIPQVVAVDFNASGNAVELRSNGVTLWTGSAGGSAPSTIFNIGSVGTGLWFTGLLYDFSLSGSSVKNFSFNGYGNTNADWEDQVGSNDGTVNGSPALFSGQGFDAYVTTLYDQSGALGQPLSRFAQHATAADTRMQFDGVNDRVDTGYKADATSDFFVEATFIMDELVANQSILADAGSERLVQLLTNASGQLQANVWSSAGIQVVATGSTTLVVGQAYTVRLTHDVSASRMTIDLDGVQDGTGTYTGTFNAANYNAITVGAFPSGILLFNGLIYDVNFNDESTYQGYGNTNAAWEDQVGSNDGTVAGSPSIYEGRNALQATAASQPQIVADGVVVTGDNGLPEIRPDGTNDSLNLGNMSTWGISSATAFQVIRSDRTLNASQGFHGLANPFLGDRYTFTNGAAFDGSFSSTRQTFAVTDGVVSTDHLYTVLSKSAEWTARINGSQVFTTGTNTAAFSATARLFDSQSASLFFQGGMQEMVIYGSDQSSNYAAIEANIASRYGITI